MTPPKKEKNSKGSIFSCCCPLASETKIKTEDALQKHFGKEFTDYEYVIENLAIKRAPKVLLDCLQCPLKNKKSKRTTQTIKPCAEKCSTLAVKASPQEVVLGPVVDLELSGGSVAKKLSDPSCAACAIGPLMTKQTHYQCLIRNKEKDDFLLKKVLLPPSQIQRVEHPKIQISADVHDDSEEGMLKKETKAIPPEIQKIIEALKVAKPQLPLASQKRNPVNLMRMSVSDTSCDNKETLCNLLGGDQAKGETTEETRSSLNAYSCDSKRKSLSKLLKQAKETSRVAASSTRTTVGRYEILWILCKSNVWLNFGIF